MYVPPSKTRDRPVAVLNPLDAELLGVREGQEIEISGQDGNLVAEAKFDGGLARGAVTIAQGWMETNVSRLCSPHRDIDPLIGQPVMTGLPVTIAPFVTREG